MFYKEKLEFLRERFGITQKVAGNLINLDSGTYSHYEKEELLIPIKHLNILCNYYDVSIDYIFSFTTIKQYENSIKEINIKLAGERLKEFRKNNKITQEKLAFILNTNQSVIANYERGRTVIAIPFLYTICKKYNISADYLLGKIDSPKYFS